MKRLLVALIVCLPLHASAEVRHYNLCTLEPGKTLDDVRSWVSEWRALVTKNKLDYSMRILLPHADSEVKLNQFFLEGSSPTLITYAKGWDWWNASADAQALNTKLFQAASCDSGAVYLTAD